MERNFASDTLTYNIIGKCMEVHNYFGKGCLEIIYKDALEIELKNNGINFQREVRYDVEYKGSILPHFFVADFVINEQIILEAKAVTSLNSEHLSQTMNYLKISGKQLGLIVNLGHSPFFKGGKGDLFKIKKGEFFYFSLIK